MPRLEVAEQFVTRARSSHTEADLFHLMEDITIEIGFRYFALINHVDLRSPSNQTIHIDNYPISWSRHFIDNGLFAHDPILHAGLTSNIGFAWTEVPKMIVISRRQRAILDDAARHGLGNGFTVPANIPGESNGSCSFATRRGIGPPNRNLLLAQLIGAFAFQAARRLKQIDSFAQPRPPRLTSRQRDCLLWTIRGKTDWEISQILGLGQETVSRHLDMARQRYNVAKRMQLAVRAIFDGQISFIEAFAWQFPPKRE